MSEQFPPIYCDGINWVSLVMPFDIPGKIKTGELVIVSLKERPEPGRYTLLDYGTDDVRLALYDGQSNATGRLYRWIGQTMEEREREVAEQRGLVDECCA